MMKLWSVLVAAALFVAAVTVHAQAPGQSEWLARHNAARSAVGVPALTWNATAYQTALAWARIRAASPGCYSHSPGASRPGLGENIAWSSDAAVTPTQVVNLWVAERANYSYSTNSCRGCLPCGQSCGHYTQVVWRATRGLGCASAVCGRGSGQSGRFFVCNYYPAGNIIGRRPY